MFSILRKQAGFLLCSSAAILYKNKPGSYSIYARVKFASVTNNFSHSFMTVGKKESSCDIFGGWESLRKRL